MVQLGEKPVRGAFSSTRSSFAESQKVAKPPKAPLALTALPGPFFQNEFLARRRAYSSIFVSWIRRTSVLTTLTKSLIASSFREVPSPLQFQETYCIIYLFEGDGPLSGFSQSSTRI